MANFIYRFCRIKNGKVIVDGREIYSSASSLSDLLEQVYDQLKLSYPKFYKMDNLSKLGFLSSELLLGGSDARMVDPFEVSVVLSNSSSSLDTDRSYYESTKKAASPALFVYTLPNIVNGEISIRHGLKGESSFFVTPQFDAELLCTNCSELLEEKSKLCVAGWLEVMNENYDCFLYLVGRDAKGLATEHTVENLESIYSA